MSSFGSSSKFQPSNTKDLDHDGSTVESYAGRVYILEGITSKHGEELEEQNKIIGDLKEQIAALDWQIKQLQWAHPELKVEPPATSVDRSFTFDPNPGKVPDPH